MTAAAKPSHRKKKRHALPPYFGGRQITHSDRQTVSGRARGTVILSGGFGFDSDWENEADN